VKRLFELLLVARLLFPFFDPPVTHLYSDPQRHWDNAAYFLHPGIMGSSDPFLYQLWLWGVRRVAAQEVAIILLACGLLCALMPYGWYRALRELLPRHWALGGAIVIALIPESISMYAYFMNETLLMSLLGACFWFTLRSYRKRTFGAYALACVAWWCAALTRTIALPMAAACLGVLWLTQQQRLRKAAATVAIAAALVIPAGLHARRNLHYFAPFGNLYSNSIYHDSGMHDVALDYGPLGQYQFGAPSFYNPTYYPFSNWTTDRTGVVEVHIDTTRGRADWQRERERVLALRRFPYWRQRWEDLQYLLFAQNWPNQGTSTWISAATLWTRWLWAPLVLFVVWTAGRRWYRGMAWLLAGCGLGTFALLMAQTQGVTEARFREPIDALLVAAALCACYQRRQVSRAAALRPGVAGPAPACSAATGTRGPAAAAPPSLAAAD
jgi:hypothetical protein